MVLHKRIAHVALTVGVISGGLVASSGAATAATPTCETVVVGVLPDGRLIERDVTNTRATEEKQTATALPFRVDWLGDGGGSDRTGDTRIDHYTAYAVGELPRAIDIQAVDSSPTLTLQSSPTTYTTSFPARLPASSASFYRYGVDNRGNLKRWTWFTDNANHLSFGNPKLVARHQGGLRTLAFDWAHKSNGVTYDVLYGTTRSGALKQFRIPLKKPAKVKITTLERSGFARYTGVSTSFCNRTGTQASLIYVDRNGNKARWYTVSQQFAPSRAKVVRHGLVAPGAEWRLNAVY